MDTKKLLFEVDSDSFFGHYTETLRNLYDDAFIARNHLLPSTVESFSKSMALQAGRRGAVTSFSEEDLIKIAQETNTKYEEYATGGYTPDFRKQGEERYRSKSKILYETFMALGCEKAASILKYAADPEKNNTTAEDPEENNTETEDQEAEIRRYEEVLQTTLEDLKANGTKKYTIVKNLIEDARKFAEESDQDTDKIKKLLDEIQRVLDHPEDKKKAKEEDPEDKIKKTMMVEDLMTQLNHPEEVSVNITVPIELIPEAIITALDDLKKQIGVEIIKRNDKITALEKEVEGARKSPTTDSERVELIMSVISEVEDLKVLKPVMIALMTKVL